MNKYPLHLTNHFNSIESLKKRIRMLYTKKHTRTHLLRFVIMVPILVGSITLLAFRSPDLIALKLSKKGNTTFQKVIKSNVQPNIKSSNPSALKPLNKPTAEQSSKTTIQNKEEAITKPHNLVKTVSLRDSLSKRDKEIIGSTVYFFYNNSTLENKASKKLLQEIALILKKHPHINLLLTGHTEKETKDETFYQKISEERVKNVKAYLQALGVDNKRLKTKAYGSTKPVSSNETKFGRIKNNRVNFIVLKKN